MTHAEADLSVVELENRRMTHTGTSQEKTLPVTTLTQILEDITKIFSLELIKILTRSFSDLV
jgi:hypothetical protein